MLARDRGSCRRLPQPPAGAGSVGYSSSQPRATVDSEATGLSEEGVAQAQQGEEMRRTRQRGLPELPCSEPPALPASARAAHPVALGTRPSGFYRSFTMQAQGTKPLATGGRTPPPAPVPTPPDGSSNSPITRRLLQATSPSSGVQNHLIRLTRDTFCSHVRKFQGLQELRARNRIVRNF